MTKSLVNRLYLKERLFSLDCFALRRKKGNRSRIILLILINKIILNLENIGVRMEDEDQVVILLNSLPRTNESFKDTMKYGREC